MNNLREKLIEKGWTPAEADNIVKDVVDIIPELVKSGKGFSIRNFGTLYSVVKDKPKHLMKEGSHSKTFKIKFTQSRSIQKDFVKSQSSSLREAVKKFL